MGFQVLDPECLGPEIGSRGGHSLVSLLSKDGTKSSALIFGGTYRGVAGAKYLNELVHVKLEGEIREKVRFKKIQPKSSITGRALHGSVLFQNNLLVIFGGKGEKGQVFRDMHFFNISKKEWSSAPGITVGLPAGRFGHVFVDAGDGENIILYGGTNEHQYFSDWHVYNLRKGIWQSIKTKDESISPRVFAAACVGKDGMLYLHGGLSGNLKTGDIDFLNDLWRIDIKLSIATGELKAERISALGDCPSPRYMHCLTALSSGAILMSGGYQGNSKCKSCGILLTSTDDTPITHKPDCVFSQFQDQPKSHGLYMLESGAWSAIGNISTVYGHATFADDRDNLMIFGGWDGNKSLNTVKLVVHAN
jgi:Rab9 effector protein with kelch motifs